MTAGRVGFTLDGSDVEVDAAAGESLLAVLREQLGVRSAKDGCAPQGQCGCCTVLVDGEPRVACVTPATRVAGRAVTTIDGLDGDERDTLAAAFVATGGSQCGFCTPGIVLRAAWLRRRGKTAPIDLDRALAAHLCRCTGWRSVVEAITAPPASAPAARATRSLDLAARRAELEGGVRQRVALDVPLGAGGFADDTAPAGALVAVPRPPASDVAAVEAAGQWWVVGESLTAARAAAAKVQGRRTTVEDRPPLAPLPAPAGGVALATGWVEPGYLEPDASWCAPGGEPASPLANGGAFGGKLASLAPQVARELADHFRGAVRVVYSREDIVRMGPKRPPMTATALFVGDAVHIDAQLVGAHSTLGAASLPYRLHVEVHEDHIEVTGPSVSNDLRAAGWAERTVLVEGALMAAGVDRATVVREEFAAALLDTLAVAPSGAAAGARVTIDADTGVITGVEVTLLAGDPLDEIVLRSYALGAVHMAIGWVLTEGIAVDPETGEVHDLTIRSFGIIPARAVPPVNIRILDDPRPPLAQASDAAFAAVAAATWNAVTAADGVRPTVFPARTTRSARALR